MNNKPPHEIPNQIKKGNISPIQPQGKGDGFIPKQRILLTCEHLNIDFETIDPEAWSHKNGAQYVSWKGFWKLPDEIQDHINRVDLKKGLDLGIKTGKQRDGSFLLVFDCDNDQNNALEYKSLIEKTYGPAFTRKTPSGGYHIYYHSDGRILRKRNQHIDLRHYIEIDGIPLPLEIKQGSFIKEVGDNRVTVDDLEIGRLDHNIDFIQELSKQYPGLNQIKSFEEESTTSPPHINNESLNIPDEELLQILETFYLPQYISKNIQGHLENTITTATFGFLIKKNMPIIQMKKVLEWINDVAEKEKARMDGRSPDNRNYNFEKIPRKLAGSGILRKYGFHDFVKAITTYTPEWKNIHKDDKPTEIKGLIRWYIEKHQEIPVQILTNYLSKNLDLYKDLTTQLFYERKSDGSFIQVTSERIVIYFNKKFGVDNISQSLAWQALNGITNPIKKDYNIIEFKNGILNTLTKEFNEDKGQFNEIPKISLPFNWKDNYEKDRIRNLITEILTHKDHPCNTEQWIKTVGYFFMADNNEDIHTIVVGPPGTGKTTLATILEHLFNCSNVKTTVLNKSERFQLYPIIDKDINIDDDINNGLLKDIGGLNSLVSGKSPDIERKGKDEPIKPKTEQIPKLYACGNTLPPILGGGFWARLNLIYALNEFRGTQKDNARIQANIKEGKYDEDLEWLVWEAIHTYWKIRDNNEKILNKPQILENETYYRYQSYPLLAAIDELYERTTSDDDWMHPENIITDLLKWSKTHYEKGIIMEEHSQPDVKLIKKSMGRRGFDLKTKREGDEDINGYQAPIRVYTNIKKRPREGQATLDSEEENIINEDSPSSE